MCVYRRTKTLLSSNQFPRLLSLFVNFSAAAVRAQPPRYAQPPLPIPREPLRIGTSLLIEHKKRRKRPRPRVVVVQHRRIEAPEAARSSIYRFVWIPFVHVFLAVVLPVERTLFVCLSAVLYYVVSRRSIATPVNSGNPNPWS